MTPNELDQLEARAKAATKGPYKQYCAPLRVGMASIIEVQTAGGMAVIPWTGFDAFDGSRRQKKANAAFFAATSPDVILALIAELRMTRRALEMATANPYNYAGWQKPSDWLSEARKELETE